MKLVHQSLSSQLKINEDEIEYRKALFKIDETLINSIKKYKYVVRKNLDVIVNNFYENQVNIDEISLLIGDVDTLSRLKNAQKRYISSLFSGVYDLEYINDRLRIGLVHKRIGVSPRLYLSAIENLKDCIAEHIKFTFSSTEEEMNFKASLDTLIHFDTSYVFDTYIKYLVSEKELSQKVAEKYADELENKIAERTQKLKDLMYQDELTGIYSRRALFDLGNKTLELCKRRNSPLSVIYFDLNDLKITNDMYGHKAGDKLIKTFSSILSNSTREEDAIFRLGGDEFCIFLCDCNEYGALKIISKISDAVRNSDQVIKFSYGISVTGPDKYSNIDTLIDDSDQKMYDHKMLIKFAKEKNMNWTNQSKDDC